MGLSNTRQSKVYANIISDGSIRVKCEENDVDAVVREYELKDGTKGTKHEKVYTQLSGKIVGVNFYDGQFGKTLQVVFLDENDDDITLCTGVTSNFASDILKKLPNINLEEEVVFKPYSFEDDNGKNRKGVTVFQNGEKLKDYFHEMDNGKIKPLYEFPEAKQGKKKFDSADWKIYFLTVSKFLEEYTTENIIPNFKGEYGHTVLNDDEPTIEEQNMPEAKSIDF